ncbi:hypothetical protein Droror1_Dr00026566 [Drosera rotundifolia]
MTSHFTTPNALRSHLLPSSVPIPIRFAFFGSNSKVYLRNPPTKIFSGVSATTIASCHLLLCISPCTASLKGLSTKATIRHKIKLLQLYGDACCDDCLRATYTVKDANGRTALDRADDEIKDFILNFQ